MRKHRSGIVGRRRASSGSRRCPLMVQMVQTAFERFPPQAKRLKRVTLTNIYRLELRLVAECELKTEWRAKSRKEGELLPSQDTVFLPTPMAGPGADDDAADVPPTSASNRVASLSQLSFMVRPDSFERGQLRLTCIASVYGVYSERAELVINEERPQIASVLGTRDSGQGSWLSFFSICHAFV
ncbi:hypothetical protein EVAR_52632_1 [Eumeta japonica]|uniref:CD80-like immunoglobulin C2-set domain-containing protein n=1 Tax=Eumeta variegata TaxID=151549 RepID=A0A4C1XWZ0_EUMVA|nr:hypothetical protein EVAR_52632_1 [Eumeta japonica]